VFGVVVLVCGDGEFTEQRRRERRAKRKKERRDTESKGE
jgi:hypothetical protein